MANRQTPFDTVAREVNPIKKLESDDQDTAGPTPADDDRIKRTVPSIVASRASDNQSAGEQDKAAVEADAEEEQQAGAEIVSLDAFRKK